MLVRVTMRQRGHNLFSHEAKLTRTNVWGGWERYDENDKR